MRFQMLFILVLALNDVHAQNEPDPNPAGSLVTASSVNDHYEAVATFILDTTTLKDIETNCGCTVADWSATPLNPGAAANVKFTTEISAQGPLKIPVNIYVFDAQSQFLIAVKPIIIIYNPH